MSHGMLRNILTAPTDWSTGNEMSTPQALNQRIPQPDRIQRADGSDYFTQSDLRLPSHSDGGKVFNILDYTAVNNRKLNKKSDSVMKRTQHNTFSGTLHTAYTTSYGVTSDIPIKQSNPENVPVPEPPPLRISNVQSLYMHTCGQVAVSEQKPIVVSAQTANNALSSKLIHHSDYSGKPTCSVMSLPSEHSRISQTVQLPPKESPLSQCRSMTFMPNDQLFGQPYTCMLTPGQYTYSTATCQGQDGVVFMFKEDIGTHKPKLGMVNPIGLFVPMWALPPGPFKEIKSGEFHYSAEMDTNLRNPNRAYIGGIPITSVTKSSDNNNAVCPAQRVALEKGNEDMQLKIENIYSLAKSSSIPNPQSFNIDKTSEKVAVKEQAETLPYHNVLHFPIYENKGKQMSIYTDRTRVPVHSDSTLSNNTNAKTSKPVQSLPVLGKQMIAPYTCKREYVPMKPNEVETNTILEAKMKRKMREPAKKQKITAALSGLDNNKSERPNRGKSLSSKCRNIYDKNPIPFCRCDKRVCRIGTSYVVLLKLAYKLKKRHRIDASTFQMINQCSDKCRQRALTKLRMPIKHTCMCKSALPHQSKSRRQNSHRKNPTKYQKKINEVSTSSRLIVKNLTKMLTSLKPEQNGCKMKTKRIKDVISRASLNKAHKPKTKPNNTCIYQTDLGSSSSAHVQPSGQDSSLVTTTHATSTTEEELGNGNYTDAITFSPELSAFYIGEKLVLLPKVQPKARVLILDNVKDKILYFFNVGEKLVVFPMKEGKVKPRALIFDNVKDKSLSSEQLHSVIKKLDHMYSTGIDVKTCILQCSSNMITKTSANGLMSREAESSIAARPLCNSTIDMEYRGVKPIIQIKPEVFDPFLLDNLSKNCADVEHNETSNNTSADSRMSPEAESSIASKPICTGNASTGIERNNVKPIIQIKQEINDPYFFDNLSENCADVEHETKLSNNTSAGSRKSPEAESSIASTPICNASTSIEHNNVKPIIQIKAEICDPYFLDNLSENCANVEHNETKLSITNVYANHSVLSSLNNNPCSSDCSHSYAVDKTSGSIPNIVSHTSSIPQPLTWPSTSAARSADVLNLESTGRVIDCASIAAHSGVCVSDREQNTIDRIRDLKALLKQKQEEMNSIRSQLMDLQAWPEDTNSGLYD